MAATYGRLTGKPGVCLTTLGPGALNLAPAPPTRSSARMPMMMITGQKPIMSSRQARFQIVDVVATMRPLTKLSRQIVSADQHPDRWCARPSAWRRRSGPVRCISSCPRTSPRRRPRPRRWCRPIRSRFRWRSEAALDRAAEMILQAPSAAGDDRRRRQPAALDRRCSPEFVQRTGIPFFTTQMGKGTSPAASELYMGTAALSERDYVHEAIDRADVIVTIGHDTVEKPPFIMGPGGPQVIHVGFRRRTSSRSISRRPR